MRKLFRNWSEQMFFYVLGALTGWAYAWYGLRGLALMAAIVWATFGIVWLATSGVIPAAISGLRRLMRRR